MSNPNPILNSSSSTTRKPAGLHTSQSLETITGNGLVASPIDTRFPESHPESGIAVTHNDRESESHHMPFLEFPAEGGRYAEFDMGGTMLSLGSDPSMSSFGSGSGCAFAPLPGFLQQGNTEAGPTLSESVKDIPRRFTNQVAERGMFQSMDMSLRPTARVTRRFGSVVLHNPRMSGAIYRNGEADDC